MTEVERFLSSHPPFGSLEPEAIASVADAVVVESFAAGETILSQAGEPAQWIYVVRRGGVELRDGPRVIDVLEEGDLFGHLSLLSAEAPVHEVRAREDTLCYLLPASVAHRVFGATSGSAFLVASLRSRPAPGRPSLYPLLSAVEVARSPLLVVGPERSLAEVAEEMTRAAATAVLVRTRAGWGIVTDRDIRARAVAGGMSSSRRVSDIVTVPVRWIDPDASADEALLEMLDLGVHHLPVMSGGEPVAMLTDLDLLGLRRRDAFRLRSEMERASDREEVVRRSRQLPELVATLVEAGTDAEHVGRVTATLTDAVTRRLLELELADGDEPPVPFAWLALGSGGRREQGLSSDQDHALVHAGGDVENRYFCELAARVVAALDLAGYPRCPSKVMASEEGWYGCTEWWRRRLREWMEVPDRAATFLTGIVFDARPVAGALDVAPIWTEAVEMAGTNPPFLRRLARLATELRPPLGFLGNLVVQETSGEEEALDIKAGGLLAVAEIARLAALEAGSGALGTRARLEAAVQEGSLDGEDGSGLGEAFRVFSDIRLRHQAEQWRRGERPDNLVAPSRLGRLERGRLKDAFGLVRHVQSRLSGRLAPRILGR